MLTIDWSITFKFSHEMTEEEGKHHISSMLEYSKLIDYVYKRESIFCHGILILASDDVILLRHGIFPHFQPDFRQILRVILMSKVLNISIGNRNVPTPVKMRGPSTSADVELPRYSQPF